MVIKMDYRIIAVLLAVCLFGALLAAEKSAPAVLQAERVWDQEDETILELPVVMYHHLLEEPSQWNDYITSPAQFEEDLRYLQQCGYTSISVQELLDYLSEDAPLPEKPVLITFDDAYESVYQYAYPLLKKYGMKAVVSVIGSSADQFSNPDEPRHIRYSYLSWAQLKELAESGVFELGNHTYNLHRNGQDSERYGIRIREGESVEEYARALYADIGKLNQKIQEETGIRPIIFAYPFGALCKESRPILEEMGFEVILTCEEKVNRLAGDETPPLELRRYNRAHHYSTYEYFKKMGITGPESK